QGDPARGNRGKHRPAASGVMCEAPVVELRHPPVPAPPMTLPVLLRTTGAGCLIGVLVLAIDAWAPGRIGALVGYVDPAAVRLVGGGPLPLTLLGVSVAMNGAFYGLLAMIALVAMTLGGIRASFERHHWVL